MSGRKAYSLSQDSVWLSLGSLICSTVLFGERCFYIPLGIVLISVSSLVARQVIGPNYADRRTVMSVLPTLSSSYSFVSCFDNLLLTSVSRFSDSSLLGTGFLTCFMEQDYMYLFELHPLIASCWCFSRGVCPHCLSPHPTQVAPTESSLFSGYRPLGGLLTWGKSKSRCTYPLRS